MLNTLLFVHLIIAVLMVIVILLQKTNSDGLSGIGGGGNNMGVMSGRAAANFLTKTTIVLSIIFFVNAIVIANLSTQKYTDMGTKLDNYQGKEAKNEEEALPIAK